MTEDRRCGTCRWWTQFKYEHQTGWCFPPAEKLPAAYHDSIKSIPIDAIKGTDCPTWEKADGDQG